MGWMVPPIANGVLEQNFMPDALPDTTQFNWDPVFGGG